MKNLHGNKTFLDNRPILKSEKRGTAFDSLVHFFSKSGSGK